MKKLISVVLLLAMVLGLFAGCGKNDEAAAGLQSAAEYLTGMYQTAGKDEAIVISADLDVLSSVVVDGVSYGVQWAVEVTEGDADSVTVSESGMENHVKLDVPLRSDTDILFTATATVSDAEGNTQAVTFNYKVKGAGMTMEELVEAAYALDEDQAMEEPGVLIGVVTMINTPYDEGYQNLTCTIVVEDMTGMVTLKSWSSMPSSTMFLLATGQRSTFGKPLSMAGSRDMVTAPSAVMTTSPVQRWSLL